MTALAANRSAAIGENGLRRLVEASRRVAALRSPLVRHPRLNAPLAEQLYGWVGQSLRQAIHERFQTDKPTLRAALGGAVATVARTGPAPPAAALPACERDEMEQRLIGKLSASGQLRPGYLIRAIREGRLGLFENALASLGGYSPDHVRAAVRAKSPDPLALACASVGIDRAVYPALLEEVRRLSGGNPTGDLSEAVWSGRSAEAAAREFRALSTSRFLPPRPRPV